MSVVLFFWAYLSVKVLAGKPFFCRTPFEVLAKLYATSWPARSFAMNWTAPATATSCNECWVLIPSYVGFEYPNRYEACHLKSICDTGMLGRGYGQSMWGEISKVGSGSQTM